MVTVKAKARISFDGKPINVGQEIQMTKERFKEMSENFKKQDLLIDNFIEVIAIDKEKEKRVIPNVPKEYRVTSDGTTIKRNKKK